MVLLCLVLIAGGDPLVDYPFNDAERALFADVIRDRRLDSFDMIEAALIASGVETLEQVKIDRAKLEKSLAKIVDDVGTEGDDRQRAKRLLESLHTRLLRRYQRSAAPLDYVIGGGAFNCVSATVLYNSLAKRTNLVTKAVVLPTHVLTLLLTTSGPVEVETTSPRGFHGNRRDQSYIEFLTARGLHGWNTRRGAFNPDIAKTTEIDNLTLIGLIYHSRGLTTLGTGGGMWGRALLQRARWLSQTESAEELRDYEATIVNRVASEAVAKGDHTHAAELIDFMLSELPAGSELHILLTQHRNAIYEGWAESLQQRGDYDAASALYERAVRETNDPNLRYKLLVMVHNTAVRALAEGGCVAALPYIEKGLALGDKRTFQPMIDQCKRE